MVRKIKKRVGDQVEKGELLAKIESNQSLTVYEMRAPIAGTIIDRQITLGEFASEQKPSFRVSAVWVAGGRCVGKQSCAAIHLSSRQQEW